MPSIADELQRRADEFGIQLLAFLRTLPRDPVTDVLVRQLARSGAGIGGNYRATRRARSRAEFIARLAVVVEEADESVYWLEQAKATTDGARAFDALLDECRQLLAIFSRSLSTARQNHAAQKRTARRRIRDE